MENAKEHHRIVIGEYTCSSQRNSSVCVVPEALGVVDSLADCVDLEFLVTQKTEFQSIHCDRHLPKLSRGPTLWMEVSNSLLRVKTS